MVKITVKKTGVEIKILRRELNNINREVFKETGEWFHGRYVKKRFTRRGAAELGFTPRKPATVRIKKKLFGHNLPNVFSGGSRALARIRNVKATATNKRAQARIILRTPLLNLKNPKSTIHPAEEIRRVSDNEAARTSVQIASLKESKIKKYASRK